MALALIGALLCAADGGFHAGVSAGAGFSYDGVAGVRAEARYGPFGVGFSLGLDALGSSGRGAQAPFGRPATVSSSFPHSFAASVRFVSGRARGLVLSLTNWRQWEHTSSPPLPEPHLDDRYSVWQPALGWRFAGEHAHLELALGLPISSHHYFVIADEGPPDATRVHVSGFGWTGCGQCDLMPWPTLELGAGFEF